MDLYMAGSTFEELNDWMMQRGYNKLFSQLNDRGEIENWVRYKNTNHAHCKLFIDSGAFTVHTQNTAEKIKKRGGKLVTVDVDEYINYLNQIESGVDVYAQVDYIPGIWGSPKTVQQLTEAPAKSWENYLYMSKRLKNKDKLLPIFHNGEDYKWLKTMLEYTDENGKHIPYIGISTNKDTNIRRQKAWLETVFDIISKSSNPNVKTHAFGLTSLKTLKAFPITSADSTGWLRVATTGSIFTDLGTFSVSEQTQHNEDNFNNWIKDKQVKLIELVESKGYKMEELIKDYKQRELWNIQYLQEWAAKQKYEERDLSLNTLF